MVLSSSWIMDCAMRASRAQGNCQIRGRREKKITLADSGSKRSADKVFIKKLHTSWLGSAWLLQLAQFTVGTSQTQTSRLKGLRSVHQCISRTGNSGGKNNVNSQRWWKIIPLLSDGHNFAAVVAAATAAATADNDDLLPYFVATVATG